MVMTARDRWICWVLPALAVVLAYSTWGARPLLRGLRDLRRELAVQESADACAARLAASRKTALRLEQELEEANARNAGGDAVVDLGQRRLGTLKEIARRCEANGVDLLEATPDGSAAPSYAGRPAGLPANLEKAGWTNPQWWTLTLRGTYPAVRKLLEDLRAAPSPNLPARLDMRLGDDASQPHSWTLGLWM